jgi:hypothetical protein
MPAFTAHHYFGQEVAKRLPAGIAALIARHAPAFDLGLQGPDLLFYYKPYRTNDVLVRGELLHRVQADETIGRAARAVRKSGEGRALCYPLGFACHFVLDSGLHGDIAQTAPELPEHFRLETEMDRQIILTHYSQRPEAFKRHRLVRLSARDCGWPRLIYPDTNEKQLKKCVRGMAFYLGLLRAHGLKKRLLMAAESALRQPGFFSGMIVGDKNERYYAPAQELCRRLEDLVPAGADAVMHVYECVAEKAPLPETFHGNFE